MDRLDLLLFHAYFLADDPAVGPTDSVWWGGSRETVTVPLESTCLAQGQTVNATMKAQQKVCSSFFQMNAGRTKNTCPHSLALQLDVRMMEQGVTWLLLSYAAVAVGDSAAFYGGTALGRHRLAPALTEVY